MEAAIVRNVRRHRVGVEFLRFQHSGRERLQPFIRALLLGRRSGAFPAEIKPPPVVEAAEVSDANSGTAMRAPPERNQ